MRVDFTFELLVNWLEAVVQRLTRNRENAERLAGSGRQSILGECCTRRKLMIMAWGGREG
jgi:hypothetical protein